MESSVVVKVKYGDTLRRFTAQVDENNCLDLDMVGLRAKILSLFNMTADANLILRYVDEDGDLVTLVEDNDLHDVMRQRLKFLRIDVHNNNSGVKSNARSSGSSTATPLRPSPIPNSFLSGNSAILKSVPEPLREALSNLSLDLVSKDASSSPVLATVTDCISKMGQSFLNSDSQSHVAADPSSKEVVPDPVTPKLIYSKSKYVGSTSNASQQVEAGNVSRDVVAGVAPVDLNAPPCYPNPSQSTSVSTAPYSSPVSSGDGRKGKTSADDPLTGKGDTRRTYPNYVAPHNCLTYRTSSGSSPFTGWPLKRSHSHIEATDGMFHKGVQCDACGVYPITGPRFKSEVKDNYDLCSICFNEMGNETDYIRIDRPVSVPAPRVVNCGYQNPPWMGSPALPHIFRTGGIQKAHAMLKLDSRFILDVNVVDGTMMAPSTVFTKIWRMRNYGTSVWPKGTQLVWIGGDKFSTSPLVYLEVPEDGVPVGKELDIAVDFRAPQLPGRYISYWRMASPSGQKFGQRVWVFIQVDASLKDSFYDSSQGLNLNIPLDVNDSKGPGIDINVQPMMDDAFLQPQNPSSPANPVEQMVVEQQPRQELGNEWPLKEDTLIGHGASLPATSVAPSPFPYPVLDLSGTAAAVPSNQLCSTVIASSSPLSYPIIDSSKIAPAVPSNHQSSAVGALSSSQGIGGDHSALERILPWFEQQDLRPSSTVIAPPSIDFSKVNFTRLYPVAPSNQQSPAVGTPSPSQGIGESNSVPERLLKLIIKHGFKQPAIAIPPSPIDFSKIEFSKLAPAAPANQLPSAVGGLSSSRGIGVNNSVQENYSHRYLLKQLEQGFEQPSTVTVPPPIDFSKIAPAAPSNQQSSAVGAPASSWEICGNNSVQEGLLKQLEEMGFKQSSSVIAPSSPVPAVFSNQQSSAVGVSPSSQEIGGNLEGLLKQLEEMGLEQSSSVIAPSSPHPAAPSNQQSSAVVAPSSSGGIGGNNSVQATLLGQLEEMGFKQINLNKKILRKNDYNLEQSVDDLCGAWEWDPILEDLQEMGFSDEDLNQRLLVKNNGSVEDVVMDLINGKQV